MKYTLLAGFLCFYAFAKAQTVASDLLQNIRHGDNIGENQVQGSPSEGSLFYDDISNKIKFFDGVLWFELLSNSTAWSLDGQNGSTGTPFLGHIDDQKMEIRSNNIAMLEFGRRQTLGLVQNYPDYTDVNQSVIYARGIDGKSALQFQANGASFYKPTFFTTDNGSFRLKGSAGSTDLFEIGSFGPDNAGAFDFTIGDDGAEPIIFRRYDYRGGRFTREFYRVQGSSNSRQATTRFGINLNTSEIPVDTDYDDNRIGDSSNTAVVKMANSTLQVAGSVSLSIIRTTGNLTLTEDHYTILVGGNHNIALPTGNNLIGRIYVIKNLQSTTTVISSYINRQGIGTTSIPSNSLLWLQNDGVNWQQIN